MMNDFNEDTFEETMHTDWLYISQYQTLSEEFIEKYSDKLDWYYILQHQTLSEKFIEKFSDEVDWINISIYQTLSEEFIEKYSDKVYWSYISQNQTLSEEFIEKYSDKVYWSHISRYQILSEEFRNKHQLVVSENCWLYKTKQEKLDYIKENTNYEIVDDNYIMAYKSVRHDYSSVYFPSKYKYEIGKTYESNCDYNIDNKNSFGLAAWTKNRALEYHSIGRLLKVRMNIEDIGAIVHKDSKLRCKKMTILLEVDKQEWKLI